jgi:hypothetical protein
VAFLFNPVTKLWVAANALQIGCGKTVLCSIIIEKVRQVSNLVEATLCYFYCYFQDSTRQSLEDILRLFLVKLCKNNQVPVQLQELYTECHKEYPAEMPSVDQLKETCYAIVEGRPSEVSSFATLDAEHIALAYKSQSVKQIYLVIDALDEIPVSKTEEVLQFLQDFAVANLPNFHVLVTSRHDSDIKDCFQGLPMCQSIFIDKATVIKDIDLYVERSMNDQRTRFGRFCVKKEITRKLVRQKLVAEGNGMYIVDKLHVRL